MRRSNLNAISDTASRIARCPDRCPRWVYWAVALAVGVPWFLLSTGQIGMDNEEGRAVAIALCAMFLLIGVGSSVMARRGREWRQKAVVGGKKICVACGFPPRKNDCFCAKCGCAIIRTRRDQARSGK